MMSMTLKQEQSRQFYNLAEQMGHDIHALRDGSTQSTLIKADSLERARELLSRATPQERQVRGQLFLDRVQNRQSRALLRHDRAEAFVFANGELSDTDHHFIANYLPIPVWALSVEDKVLAPNEVWDLGTSGPAVVLNISTLTMGAGSRIIIRNAVLSLTCQKLIRQSGGTAVGDGNYDIAVLGANPDEVVRLQVASTFSADLNQGTISAALVTAFGTANPLSTNALVMVITPGQAWRLIDYGNNRTYSLVVNPGDSSKILVFRVAMQGAVGPRPNDGYKGTAGTCKCSGSEPGDRGGIGQEPAASGAGGPGSTGFEGLPSMRSELNIGNLEGILVIRTQGGNGAQGGMGGSGGDGARGGEGGDGTRCAGTCTWGGDGGKGGKAGDGGKGGTGSNGGFAADLYVTLANPAQASQIIPSTLPSLAGLAGAGGRPGKPGAGGAGGSGVSHNICGGGNTGPNGDGGALGEAGSPGERGGLAGRIIINGVG
jgi:hypothetical protein